MKTNNALLQLYLFIIVELLTLETDCNKDNTGLNVKEEKNKPFTVWYEMDI